DPAVSLLRETLAAWDFQYATDSIAPTLFETFVEVWQERVIGEHVPERLLDLVRSQTGPAARLIERDDLDWFGAGTSVRDLAIGAAGRAVARVRERYGADQRGWQWGALHQAHWRHPLSTDERSWMDIGPEPVDGGIDTLRNTGGGQAPFSAGSGAEYRLVVDF